LVFEKCALSDLDYGHVINSEASDSLRVMRVALSIVEDFGALALWSDSC